MFAAQGVDVDAPRAKRQKTGAATAATATANGDAATANGAESMSGENARLVEDPEQVKERGLKLWQTIKDAKDKECVTTYSLFRMQQFGDNRLHHFSFLAFPTFLIHLSSTSHTPCSPVHTLQGSADVRRLPATTLQTSIPRLL